MKCKQLKRMFSLMGKEFKPRVVALFQKGHEPTIICNGKAVVNLSQFQSVFCELKDDDAFIIGRAEDADANLADYLCKGAFLNDISRYHCFVERQEVDETEWFVLYDTSVTDTAVVLADIAPPMW